MPSRVETIVEQIDEALDANDDEFVDGYLSFRLDEIDSELDDVRDDLDFVYSDYVDQLSSDRIDSERGRTHYHRAQHIA